MEISFAESCSGGVFTPVGVAAPFGEPPRPLGLTMPLPRPGTGVAQPLGGAADFGPSGEAGMISGGRSGILMRLASLL